MTCREKFCCCLRFDGAARPPLLEPGPLLSTYERWQKEGLPAGLTPYDYDGWCDALGLDRWPMNILYRPQRKPLFEEQVLAETETTITRRMEDGSIQQDNKSSQKTIPHELHPAVTSREEWTRLKAWLQVDAPLPGPNDPQVAEWRAKTRAAAQPVSLAAGSLVGQVRNWLGFQAFAMMSYDDPAWLEDMIETSCRAAEWQVRLCGENGVALDVVHFWEDICYKNGPMMNPAHFRQFVTPRYRRIADLAAHYGYELIEVDSDGNITALLDAWADGGVNILCPLEVQAGMEINEVQQRYGHSLRWAGGVNKALLSKGRDGVAAELRRVKPAVERGGYIPMLDHMVPPDVSFGEYCDYLSLKKEILGLK